MTDLFPVRHRPGSDSLARAFAPLVVELFAAGCFARTPASVASRSRLLPGRELPTPARLNGRNGFRRGSPDPLDGISDWRRVTRFEPQRPRRIVLRGVPLSPALNLKKTRNRIEDRDYSISRGPPSLRGKSGPQDGITSISLRRTGRAPIDASGSTGVTRRGATPIPLARW